VLRCHRGHKVEPRRCQAKRRRDAKFSLRDGADMMVGAPRQARAARKRIAVVIASFVTGIGGKICSVRRRAVHICRTIAGMRPHQRCNGRATGTRGSAVSLRVVCLAFTRSHSIPCSISKSDIRRLLRIQLALASYFVRVTNAVGSNCSHFPLPFCPGRRCSAAMAALAIFAWVCGVGFPGPPAVPTKPPKAGLTVMAVYPGATFETVLKGQGDRKGAVAGFVMAVARRRLFA